MKLCSNLTTLIQRHFCVNIVFLLFSNDYAAVLIKVGRQLTMHRQLVCESLREFLKGDAQYFSESVQSVC